MSAWPSIHVNADVLAEMEADNLAGRRRCPHCGTAFQPTNHHHTYCQRSCWRRAMRAQARERARTMPPPTPAQQAEVVAEMRAALDVLTEQISPSS